MQVTKPGAADRTRLNGVDVPTNEIVRHLFRALDSGFRH